MNCFDEMAFRRAERSWLEPPDDPDPDCLCACCKDPIYFWDDKWEFSTGTICTQCAKNYHMEFVDEDPKHPVYCDCCGKEIYEGEEKWTDADEIYCESCAKELCRIKGED